GETFAGDGFMVRKIIPFEGDAELFRRESSTTGSGGYPKGEVSGAKVTVGMDVPQAQTDAAERHISGTIENIQQHAQWQSSEIAAFNQSLPGQVQARVAARRAALSQADDLAKRLSGN